MQKDVHQGRRFAAAVLSLGQNNNNNFFEAAFAGDRWLLFIFDSFFVPKEVETQLFHESLTVCPSTDRFRSIAFPQSFISSLDGRV